MTWRQAETDEGTMIHAGGQTFEELMAAWHTPQPTEVFSWAWVARRTAKWATLLWAIVVVWTSLDNAASLDRTIHYAFHPAWLLALGVIFLLAMVTVENRAKESKEAAEFLTYRTWAEESWDTLTEIERAEVMRTLFPTGFSPLVPIGVAMAIADSR